MFLEKKTLEEEKNETQTNQFLRFITKDQYSLLETTIVFFLAITSFILIEQLIFFGKLGIGHLFFWLNVTFYTLVSVTCFWVTLTIIKSTGLFLLCSILVTFASPLFSAIGGSPDLNYSLGGNAIWLDGRLTTYGFISKATSPFLILLVFALFKHVKKLFAKNN